MKILLINDNSAHINWGAQASPPALKKIINHALPDCSITTLSHAWLKRSRYRKMHASFGGEEHKPTNLPIIRSILHRFSKPVRFYPEVADDFDFWADEWLAERAGPYAKEFIALAERADVIIYNGENSVYRNTAEGCHGIFLLWLAKMRLCKTSCIVNITAHMTDVLPIMSGMVKLVFPKLDLITVREPSSLSNLNDLGIGNVELFPDVVFALDSDDVFFNQVDRWLQRYGLAEQTYFCLSTSALPVSMPRGTWDGEVTALVRDLKEKLGLQAVLVAKDPWCLPLQEVAKRTDSVYFGPEHEYQELQPLFEKAAFLVTGHYHYAIFSAMAGCPFVPLSVNNHKMKGLCKHLGWSRTDPFDITSLNTCRTEIVEEAVRVRDSRSKLSAELIEKTNAMKKAIGALGEKIAESMAVPL